MSFAGWIRKHSLAAFFALVLIASLRIIGTYGALSHTWDEPDHIAAGTEWLTDGTMELDPSHPPLARVAAALGPYFFRGASPPISQSVNETLATKWGRVFATGLAILHRDGAYDRNLALARLGILPFFWIASLTVFLWARRYLDGLTAVVAVFLFTFLPPVLAQAGLATTDMALVAFAGASFLMTLIWLDAPAPSRSLLLGTITGLAVLSKYSALPYIPMALAGAFVWSVIAERRLPTGIIPVRKYLVPFGIAFLTCALVVWAGYRFSIGIAFGPSAGRLHRLSLPAPEFFAGILNLTRYNSEGHPGFLLGRHSHSGWWYFFPVVLAVKTPFPFLGLLLFGAVTAARKIKAIGLALASSLGILAFSLSSHLNMGVRHILPVYIGFSIVAAAGFTHLLELRSRAKWIVLIPGILLIWMTATSALSHPDYLPYFNELAGNKPENILVESDLDWGQDLRRLATRLKEVGATSLTFTPSQPAELSLMGFPPTSPGNTKEPAPGWNAASISVLRLAEKDGDIRGGPDAPWQERISPQERIGKGIWLWYFPPNVTPGK